MISLCDDLSSFAYENIFLSDKVFQVNYLIMFYAVHVEKIHMQLGTNLEEDQVHDTLKLYDIFFKTLKRDYVK